MQDATITFTGEELEMLRGAILHSEAQAVDTPDDRDLSAILRRCLAKIETSQHTN